MVFIVPTVVHKHMETRTGTQFSTDGFKGSRWKAGEQIPTPRHKSDVQSTPAPPWSPGDKKDSTTTAVQKVGYACLNI